MDAKDGLSPGAGSRRTAGFSNIEVRPEGGSGCCSTLRAGRNAHEVPSSAAEPAAGDDRPGAGNSPEGLSVAGGFCNTAGFSNSEGLGDEGFSKSEGRRPPCSSGAEASASARSSEAVLTVLASA
ncbi:hypothetical protein AB0K12_34945 [Nonomuraea sp. NPDC049419]|uniref:hypothetical protein n=1 Tax=Nonomuraea sp. NPDC049419 TaxID=3155772 RepID=UPI0034462FE1